jgi:exosortase/archaeosortase family protein
LGVAIYMVSIMGPPTLNHFNIQGAGVWLTLFGLVLLFFGWRAMTWLWFPLLYIFFFGQNISEQLLNIVTFKMQDLTARGSEVLLRFFLEVERNGNTISIFRNGEYIPFNIAQACSGMRMLMAFLALGVAMAYTGFKPAAVLLGLDAAAGRMLAKATGAAGVGGWLLAPFRFVAAAIVKVIVLAVRNWQRVLLVLMAVPTSIFVNILRVCTLGLLSLLNVDFAAGEFHKMIGLVWLVPAFFIYLGLMWIIRHLVVEDRPATVARRGT